jgi:hypothetical protein
MDSDGKDLERTATLKLGGLLAVVGAGAVLTGLLWHGDLPDDTTATALRHIAERPEWPLIHLISIVGVLLWVGAFTGVAQSLPHGGGRLLGRLAVLAVVIGAAVFVVHYSIDGYRLKHIADAWNAAPGGERAEQHLVATALFGILGGTFRSYIAWLYGLPFLLLGLAIGRSGVYPARFGWVAVVTGAGAMLAGTTLFLDMKLVPFPMLFGGFVIPSNLWLATLGVLTWHRVSVDDLRAQRSQGAPRAVTTPTERVS